MTTASTGYNVVCLDCESIFSPLPGTPLWEKARKRHEEDGYLDALHVRGEECGCKERPLHPEAPFRVFGYDIFSREYDLPFFNFNGAVRAFIRRNHRGDAVFISGIPDNLQARLDLI